MLPLQALFEDDAKCPEIYIDSNLNVIAADRDIQNQIGRAKKITKLSRDALLMIAKSEDQSKKMTAIETVDGNPVTVQPHRTMNRVA